MEEWRTKLGVVQNEGLKMGMDEWRTRDGGMDGWRNSDGYGWLKN